MEVEPGGRHSPADSRVLPASAVLGKEDLVDVEISPIDKLKDVGIMMDVEEDIGLLQEVQRASEEAKLCYPDLQAAKWEKSADEPRFCMHYVRFGRILAVDFGGRTLYVGPHWYTALIMLAVILGVGGLFLTHVAVHVSRWHMVGGIFATLSSTVAFLNCALGDPGILRKSPMGGPDDERACAAEPVQFLPSQGNRECKACHIVQPRGSLHCEYCQVCVGEYDHHCPWMSKCIGGKNLAAFYNFLCVSLSSLLYIVMATILSPEVLVGTKR